MYQRRSKLAILAGAAMLGVAVPAATTSAHPAPPAWGQAVLVPEVSSPSADGCPIESPDGRSLYIASTRTGTLGGNDIWVAHRRNERSPWSTPENVGAPVNGAANDFCPTPLRGNRLMFVSERPGPGTCTAGPGVGDMYITRMHRRHLPDQPRHLGCVSNGTGPNFDGPEFSPSLVTTRAGRWLFFSSTGYDGNMDLYVSKGLPHGRYAAPTKIAELSTPFDDRMPNVSPDGLKMVFSSNRTDLDGEQGDFDVYMSRRARISDPWSPPVNLGPNVNTTAAETRPSLSADGERLYFGRLGDIWTSLRPHHHHVWR